ncbi:hypothetical protein OG883_45570 [Streptomyces sp. NBC_01142]|uniref:hypothetical protein n=1 Tax=Streptomyces sp. NBC_01142 TaxID=2975865 RepID=UPI002256E24F|nr:hypothetical protein [Streptomyces sp. NBC_01142]MCX4826910.1 hypothetical protein [Streptomyces sp. NBC_01142]
MTRKDLTEPDDSAFMIAAELWHYSVSRDRLSVRRLYCASQNYSVCLDLMEDARMTSDGTQYVLAHRPVTEYGTGYGSGFSKGFELYTLSNHFGNLAAAIRRGDVTVDHETLGQFGVTLDMVDAAEAAAAASDAEQTKNA